MKVKHIILALFGLSACFACSSENQNNDKSSITPQVNNEIENLEITFDLNGGIYDGSPTFKLMDVLPTSYWKFVADEAPGSTGKEITYLNHIFKGYSLGKDDPNILPDTYIVKSNITVYAQYDTDPSKECTVNWKDGTTTLASETYVVGDTPTFKGETLIHEGYVFDSWNPTPSIITDADIGKIINYNAVYVPSDRFYTVTLDYNDGTGKTEDQKVVKNECARQPIIDYSGHTLTHWSYVSGGETFTFDTPITHDIEIKANWSENIYNITYVANGGTLTSKDTDAKWHEAVVAPVLDNRPGYDKNLVKWYKTPECTGDAFAFGVPSDIESDITLYAKWPSISQVTVTFNGNGGKWGADTTKDITIDYGTRVYPPVDPVLTDNTFIGWYNQATEGTVVDFSIPITENIEVFAHWKVTTNYTITFDSDGGSIIDSITVPTGTSINKPTTDPTKPGYTFANWTVDGAKVDFPYTVIANKTFKAAYTVNSYKVQFDPNGGKWQDTTTDPKDVQGNFGTTPIIETPTNDIMIFLGWKRTSDGGMGILPIDVPEVEGSYSEVYTAIWKSRYYTVTFDSKGGSGVVEQHVVEGKTATEPDNPIREGYNFLNWYQEGQTPTTVFNFNTPINADITLHANWEVDTYFDVKWYDEDMSTIVDEKDNYIIGQNLELPTLDKTPSKFDNYNRYLFKRWSPYASPSITVTKDMEFFAVYGIDNNIELQFTSANFTIEHLSSFTENYMYGEMLSFTFDASYPTHSEIHVKINGEEVASGYTYDETTGVLNIDTKDEAIRDATSISLVAGD